MVLNSKENIIRCISCNKQLNDSEATRKYASSGTFVDLCDRCFSHVADEIPTIDGAGGSSEDYEGEFDDGSDNVC